MERGVRGDRSRAPRRSARCRARATASALSTTMAAAPMPRIIPCRRRSKGSAASSTNVVGGRCARGQEAGADPAEQRVGRRRRRRRRRSTRRQRPARIQSSAIGDGLRRARARRVDLRVRAARADQLGELRVAHGQDAEQEPAVERVGRPARAAAEVVDAPVDLGQRDPSGSPWSSIRSRRDSSAASRSRRMRSTA